MVYSAVSDSSGTISQFTRKKQIKLSHTGTLTDYQKMITVAYESAMQAGFDDIRFNDASGNYVNYWIESKTDSDTADVWIKNDYLSGDTVITMYYGNVGLSSESSGSSVFDYWDNFDDGVTGWTVESGVSFTADSSVKKRGSYSGKMGNGATNFNAVYSSIGTHTTDFIIDFDARLDGTTNARYWTLEKIASDYNNSIYVAYDNADSRLESYNGSSYDTIGNVSLDTWFKITYKVHPTTDTFDCLIDDAQETLANVARQDISTITSFTLMEGDTANNHWVDTIRIRQYVSTDPTYSIGSEQHQRRVPAFIN